MTLMIKKNTANIYVCAFPYHLPLPSNCSIEQATPVLLVKSMSPFIPGLNGSWSMITTNP